MNTKSIRRVASEFSLGMSPPRRMISNQSQVSDISTSTPSIGGSPVKHRQETTSKSKKGVNRWVSQVKDWFSTGEPSAHDWKQMKKTEYQKHGVSLKDPAASEKLQAPIGVIPEEAIKPSSGPDPEVLAKKRAVNRKQLRQAPCPGRPSGSFSSTSSSTSRELNPVAPWA